MLFVDEGSLAPFDLSVEEYYGFQDSEEAWLFGNRIALVPDSALVGIASGQLAPVVRLCVHCIFSTLPSSRDIHSLGPRIGRAS